MPTYEVERIVRGSRPRVNPTWAERYEGDRAIAADIAGAGRVGDLQGVHVDFRHPELPAEDWAAPFFWYVWGHTSLLFPGEAVLGVEALRERKAGTVADLSELVMVRPGDRVTVRSVIAEMIPGAGPHRHPHDREQRLAYLRVTRASGDEVDVQRPVRFSGTAQLLGAPTLQFFDSLVERICRHRGAELDERDWGPESSAPYNIASVAAYSTMVRFLGARDGADGPTVDLMRHVINQAALAGYMLGVGEGRPLERDADAAKRTRKPLDDKRERSKREAREKHRPIFELALAVIQEAGELISLTACADRVEELIASDPELERFANYDNSRLRGIIKEPLFVKARRGSGYLPKKGVTLSSLPAA